MMDSAVNDRLPIVALCHGPTLLSALDININGKEEPLNKGIATASLPPFEGYVGLTGRKEIQFTYDVNTHDALKETGGQTNVLADIANMSRVVKSEKDGQNIITGPGPQAASNLADATMEVLKNRWPSQ
jgi:putative intracellular protease/amidase